MSGERWINGNKEKQLWWNKGKWACDYAFLDDKSLLEQDINVAERKQSSHQVTQTDSHTAIHPDSHSGRILTKAAT